LADFAPTHIGQFIGRYFKYRSFFAANDMGEWFPHIVSVAGKKWDIDRYHGRLGRYLKQWCQGPVF